MSTQVRGVLRTQNAAQSPWLGEAKEIRCGGYAILEPGGSTENGGERLTIVNVFGASGTPGTSGERKASGWFFSLTAR